MPAYNINTATTAVTEFTNYDMNSMTVFKGRLIGADSTGLKYLDGSSEVVGTFETGYLDLKTFSNTTDLYVDRYAEVETSVTITSREGEAVDYTIVENYNKVDLAKGHSSKYFKIALTFSDITHMRNILMNVLSSTRNV